MDEDSELPPLTRTDNDAFHSEVKVAATSSGC